MEYYSAIKKNEIMPFAATWTDLEIIILHEVKSDRGRQLSYDITYMWSLKYDTNEPIYNTKTLTDIESKLMDTKAERWGRGGINEEFGIGRCKLLYIK